MSAALLRTPPAGQAVVAELIFKSAAGVLVPRSTGDATALLASSTNDSRRDEASANDDSIFDDAIEILIPNEDISNASSDVATLPTLTPTPVIEATISHHSQAIAQSFVSFCCMSLS
jgi:hypothetical protein